MGTCNGLTYGGARTFLDRGRGAMNFVGTGNGGGGNGYQPAPPKFYDPYEIYNLLPPPEYLRNMPPPAMPIPKLPCMEPYNNENNGGIPGHQGPGIRGGPGFYPPFPAHWRPAVPPPPPPPQPHVYRGRPPMQQSPMMLSHMTSTRHFR